MSRYVYYINKWRGDTMTEKRNGGATLAVALNDICTIKDDVKEIKERLEGEYVTVDKLQLHADRLARVEKIVYGVVGILLTAIILALVKLVVLQ
jgi:tetrahydromethanopterin S-methyltransferase subunit G